MLTIPNTAVVSVDFPIQIKLGFITPKYLRSLFIIPFHFCYKSQRKIISGIFISRKQLLEMKYIIRIEVQNIIQYFQNCCLRYLFDTIFLSCTGCIQGIRDSLYHSSRCNFFSSLRFDSIATQAYLESSYFCRLQLCNHFSASSYAHRATSQVFQSAEFTKSISGVFILD